MWKHKVPLCYMAIVLAAFLAAGAADGQQVVSEVLIEGTIQQAGTGIPLEGDVTVLEGSPQRRLFNYKSDSNGSFRITVESAGQVVLVAKAAGHCSSSRTLAQAVSQRVSFALSPAVHVSGEIRDETGAPVADAVVRVLYPGDNPGFRFQHEVGDVETDERGRFVLPFVNSTREFVLEVDKPGYLPSYSARYMPKGQDVIGADVVVTPGKTVAGTVSDAAGRPMQGALVSVASGASTAPPSVRATALAHLQPHRRVAVTGADGSFALSGLPAGEAVLVVRSPGRIPQRRVVSLDAQQDPPSKISFIMREKP